LTAEATTREHDTFPKLARANAQRIPERMFEALRAHFSEAQIVELTLRIALCGFFNRFNDALQIDNELEEAVHGAE